MNFKKNKCEKTMNQKDDIFSIDVESRTLSFLQQVISFSLKVLAILMTFVILCSVLDVARMIYNGIMTPPYSVLNLENILESLGGFLIVLIGIEIFLNIVLYFRKDMSHVKLVLATALMAIARKVIILDYKTTPFSELYAIAALIAALGFAYWLCRRPEKLFPPNRPSIHGLGRDTHE
jgi:uncharacterized membrane protein (DUF373 family)